jgi:hypothetical protein
LSALGCRDEVAWPETHRAIARNIEHLEDIEKIEISAFGGGNELPGLTCFALS